MILEAQKIIEDQLEKLPKDIRDAILAADLPDKFKTIANKHKLRIDQGGTLETETMLVMLGLEHSDDYTNNLKKEASMSDEEAEKIAEEVSRTIFLPIRTSLQKLHEEEKESSLASDDAKAVADKEGHVIEHPPLAQSTEEKTLQTAPDPSLDETREKDIFREKLEKQTRSAKEEVRLREPFDTAKNKPQTTAPQQTKPDPYREPIEKKDTEGIKQEGLNLTKNEQQTTDNNKTAVTPLQTQQKVEAKKPAGTPTPPAAEKLNAKTPPRVIPPPTTEKTVTQITAQKKEMPLPKTGIINMSTENVVPQADHPLAEKKVGVPQKPSVEINKTPAFAKPPPPTPPSEKISTDQRSVSSQHEGNVKDIITQKSENANNVPQDTLNILDKPKAPEVLTKEEPAEKTTIKYPQGTPASSPPSNLPQKEIDTQKQTPVPSTNEKKKDPTIDPYREPID